ncbi:16S rRNA (uracil(1498)-N(3))-methyltransferase [Alteromonas aestuariivivens]|uniref:Ribosomal RNA small subunit methyltransferase E n=1 Tax=Alteromonas aestuariivivens TaxID=1938339 RepID=A0A3D8MEK3_9ALTE|nr:16S rRNA (uracil(1498)-N(3))-methyltransferase [Alteromonas aestuariivivens]RDV29046.1 16S rRNA (uracil(1498)-N(3))-methyltransferase [Alteromonas aestuariivivens]
MRIPRLYYPHPIPLDCEFSLTDEAAHHVATVLRLKANHPVVLFNGDGNEYSGQLISVSRKQVVVEADACLTLNKESPLPLHLGQGISKGDRMDTVLQKSVELGVTEITPLITERCAVKLDEKRWQKKHQQWLKILISACEQSGRNRIPVLNEPLPLSQWFAASTKACRLVLAPGAESSLTQVPYCTHGYRLLIGPEGGLSDNEIHQAEECGFSKTSLGPRILRTETAAIASLSLLQGLHGDL